MLSKSCKFLQNRWCIGLQSQRGYYFLLCFLCASVTKKPSVCRAPFLTTSTRNIKGDQTFSLLSPFSLFLLPLFLWLPTVFWNEPLCTEMWAGCYQYISVMCNNFGRAIISKTSFDLKLDAAQLPHSDKSTKSFLGSPDTIQQLLIQGRASFRSLPLR